MRRRALLAFALLVAVLFVFVGTGEGVGHPSLPSNAIAVIEGISGPHGTITAREFWHEVNLYAAFDGKENPHEGPFSYYKTRSLEILLERAWAFGTAQRLGLSVKPAEVTRYVEKLKAKRFHGSEAAYRKSLRETKLTQADIDETVEGQLLGEKTSKRTAEKPPPPPSEQAIQEYYEAALPTQFTEKASRDVRVIANTKLKNLLVAKRDLDRDSSAAGWKKIAERYSIDPAGKATGGLNKGLPEGAAEEPLNRELFSAPLDRVEGPVEGGTGRIYLFEVLKETPGHVRALNEVRAEIVAKLKSHAAEEAYTSHTADYRDTWTSHTFCAPGFAIKFCANFAGDHHPAEAPAGCYEPNPKGGRPPACPAPVTPRATALPGSVNAVEPAGKALPQRPLPIPSH